MSQIPANKVACPRLQLGLRLTPEAACPKLRLGLGVTYLQLGLRGRTWHDPPPYLGVTYLQLGLEHGMNPPYLGVTYLQLGLRGRTVEIRIARAES